MNRIQKENRESKLAREIVHPKVKRRGEILRAIERKKEFIALELSDQDRFNQIWKELKA
ncbi:MAG: hypothetical protein AAF364_18960 [Pseudomonadota bacterium]|tara:strand:- start:315 stop:491 length:177 start_codon:yes stop_codon:yes gene_type:complete